MLLLHTDDCLCFAFDDESLDKSVAKLKTKHDLDEQGRTVDVFEYLGIELDMRGDTVEMLQTGLVKKVLKTVGMEDCTPNRTPAKEEPLTLDLDGTPFDEDWEYASIVGMLMYLVHTHPDIQFAVHQCAKFTHNPKESHANAVKKICRHLKGTEDRGIKFKREISDPEGVLRVDCCVDASFAPLWNLETSDDSSKSRTGYLIRLDDVPVTFSSKKQGETALSTTEAEYTALSTAMRELLWVRRLVEDIAEGLNTNHNRKVLIKSKVFEDNQGTIAIAKKPDVMPRTRHLHTKHHHFKENLGVDENGAGIEIEYIRSEEQIADLFTKGLGIKLFEPLRDLLMGWNTKKPTSGVQNDGAQEGELENDDPDTVPLVAAT